MDEDILLIFKSRLYIPNFADLKKMAMDEIHQMPYSEHLGYQKTITTIRKKYFWTRIK